MNIMIALLILAALGGGLYLANRKYDLLGRLTAYVTGLRRPTK